LTITFYRVDPVTVASVQCSSNRDAGRVREALAHAVSLSGRDVWVWKPGALLALHDDGGNLLCTWSSNRGMLKYHRYLDLAWESLTGSDDLEHVLSA
jgi:hypothetical protein